MLPHPVTQLLRGIRGEIVAQAPRLEFLKIKAEKRFQIEWPSAVNAMKGICD